MTFREMRITDVEYKRNSTIVNKGKLQLSETNSSRQVGWLVGWVGFISTIMSCYSFIINTVHRVHSSLKLIV